MNKFLCFFAAAALAASFCGCSTVTRIEAEPPPPVATMPEIDAFGLDCGKVMLEALRDGDYKSFVAPLPQEVAQKTSEKNFAETRRRMLEMLGDMRGFEYLSDLDQTHVKDMLWKVTFERTAKDKDGAEHKIVRTALFKLSLYIANGKPAIGNFIFM